MKWESLCPEVVRERARREHASSVLSQVRPREYYEKLAYAATGFARLAALQWILLNKKRIHREGQLFRAALRRIRDGGRHFLGDERRDDRRKEYEMYDGRGRYPQLSDTSHYAYKVSVEFEGHLFAVNKWVEWVEEYEGIRPDAQKGR